MLEIIKVSDDEIAGDRSRFLARQAFGITVENNSGYFLDYSIGFQGFSDDERGCLEAFLGRRTVKKIKFDTKSYRNDECLVWQSLFKYVLSQSTIIALQLDTHRLSKNLLEALTSVLGDKNYEGALRTLDLSNNHLADQTIPAKFNSHAVDMGTQEESALLTDGEHEAISISTLLAETSSDEDNERDDLAMLTDGGNFSEEKTESPPSPVAALPPVTVLPERQPHPLIDELNELIKTARKAGVENVLLTDVPGLYFDDWTLNEPLDKGNILSDASLELQAGEKRQRIENQDSSGLRRHNLSALGAQREIKEDNLSDSLNEPLMPGQADDVKNDANNKEKKSNAQGDNKQEIKQKTFRLLFTDQDSGELHTLVYVPGPDQPRETRQEDDKLQQKVVRFLSLASGLGEGMLKLDLLFRAIQFLPSDTAAPQHLGFEHLAWVLPAAIFAGFGSIVLDYKTIDKAVQGHSATHLLRLSWFHFTQHIPAISMCLVAALSETLVVSIGMYGVLARFAADGDAWDQIHMGLSISIGVLSGLAYLIVDGSSMLEFIEKGLAKTPSWRCLKVSVVLPVLLHLTSVLFPLGKGALVFNEARHIISKQYTSYYGLRASIIPAVVMSFFSLAANYGLYSRKYMHALSEIDEEHIEEAREAQSQPDQERHHCYTLLKLCVAYAASLMMNLVIPAVCTFTALSLMVQHFIQGDDTFEGHLSLHLWGWVSFAPIALFAGVQHCLVEGAHTLDYCLNRKPHTSGDDMPRVSQLTIDDTHYSGDRFLKDAAFLTIVVALKELIEMGIDTINEADDTAGEMLFANIILSVTITLLTTNILLYKEMTRPGNLSEQAPYHRQRQTRQDNTCFEKARLTGFTTLKMLVFLASSAGIQAGVRRAFFYEHANDDPAIVASQLSAGFVTGIVAIAMRRWAVGQLHKEHRGRRHFIESIKLDALGKSENNGRPARDPAAYEPPTIDAHPSVARST